MDDWRLRGQEDYLADAKLIQVRFPQFWHRAYREKNRFYEKVRLTAERTAARTGKWAEFLEDERIGKFWHDHCEFCWADVTPELDGEFYCTENLYTWICPECFRDFRESFRWTVAGEKQEDE